MHRLLFGGGKTKNPTATNLQTQKTKQIESLRKTNFGTVEVVRDEEYRVTVPSGSTNITLIITLPVSFPQEKPTVTVQPHLTHPWVDVQMKVVGCSNINTFSMHSDLGQAIQAIVEEFRRNPPRILPHMLDQTPSAMYPGIPPSSAMMPQGYPNYTPRSNFGIVSSSNPPTIPPRVPYNGMAAGLDSAPSIPNCNLSNTNRDHELPDVLQAFPSLKDKKLFELQELVDNEEKILELIRELPQLSQIAQEREDLSAQCVELARENLQQRPNLEELKNAILQKCQELDEVKESLEMNCERHMTLADEFDPTHIQTNLKVAVLEAEEETEQIAEDLLNKKIDIETFIQSFLQKRTLCHKRKAKEEKLNQIVMAQDLYFN
ncbi:vacuolar protein sorting-associated protein 37A-like [Gigantopelta aegis]|uniref:vacuolar protein sorting-associated protein 37A-like n=1 Tax=Gigantopelta aegis TaxID=1735272 RepID=UPI001B88CCCD|nr:vacuolar protein sorting-associated protein 37A-like [Gigantopelta aegis]